MLFFEKVISTIERFVHARRTMSMEEVNVALTERAAAREETTKEALDWQTSAVDLLKLLDLDSGFQQRRALAEELCLEGMFVGSPEQNVALHKRVMEEVASKCIKIPDA